MKICSIVIMVIYLSILYPVLSFGGKMELDRAVKDVKNKTGATRDQAIEFIDYICDTVRSIQNNMSLIASNDISKYERGRLAMDTINKYFLSKEAKIYRTSNKSKYVKTTPVEDYFNLLATNYDGRYDKIELYFQPKWLSMGKLKCSDIENMGGHLNFLCLHGKFLRHIWGMVFVMKMLL